MSTAAAAIPVYYQDPSDVLDYSFDWTTFLAGDTISTSTWPVLSDLTQVGSPTSASGITTIFLAAPAAGVVYTVTNRIVTVGGRTKEQSLRIIGRQA